MRIGLLPPFEMSCVDSDASADAKGGTRPWHRFTALALLGLAKTKTTSCVRCSGSHVDVDHRRQAPASDIHFVEVACCTRSSLDAIQ